MGFSNIISLTLFNRPGVAGAALQTAVLHYTSQLSIEPIPVGKIKRNAKFAAFWCVFLTKMKIDPENWCN